jgi:hypothetical protein
MVGAEQIIADALLLVLNLLDDGFRAADQG